MEPLTSKRQDEDHIRALKDYGFSTAKAMEIELDARRGDAYAKAFLDLAMKQKDTTHDH